LRWSKVFDDLKTSVFATEVDKANPLDSLFMRLHTYCKAKETFVDIKQHIDIFPVVLHDDAAIQDLKDFDGLSFSELSFVERLPKFHIRNLITYPLETTDKQAVNIAKMILVLYTSEYDVCCVREDKARNGQSQYQKLPKEWEFSFCTEGGSMCQFEVDFDKESNEDKDEVVTLTSAGVTTNEGTSFKSQVPPLAKETTRGRKKKEPVIVPTYQSKNRNKAINLEERFGYGIIQPKTPAPKRQKKKVKDIYEDEEDDEEVTYIDKNSAAKSGQKRGRGGSAKSSNEKSIGKSKSKNYYDDDENGNDNLNGDDYHFYDNFNDGGLYDPPQHYSTRNMMSRPLSRLPSIKSVSATSSQDVKVPDAMHNEMENMKKELKIITDKWLTAEKNQAVAEAKYSERTTLQSSIDTSTTTAFTLARDTIFSTLEKASATGASMLTASEKIIMASQSFVKDTCKQQQPIFIGASSHAAESKDDYAAELKDLKKKNAELVNLVKEEKEKADIDRAKLQQVEEERLERIKTEEEKKAKQAAKEAKIKALQQELEELQK